MSTNWLSFLGFIVGLPVCIASLSFDTNESELCTGISLLQTKATKVDIENTNDYKFRTVPADPIHIVVISDRQEALIGSLGSLKLFTTHPTIAHVITRHANLAAELDPVFGDPESILQIRVILFDSVLKDMKSKGIVPVWEWDAFGESILNPEKWVLDQTVHVEKWDNLTVHSNPMNLLRFYLPNLRQFEGLSSIIFMDDDILVKGNLAELSNISPGKGIVQIATCGLWTWGAGDGGKCESFGKNEHTPLADTDFMYINSRNKNKQSPNYLEALYSTIREVNGMEPDLKSVNYWNYGFVLWNLTEWRYANLTRKFEAWMAANYEKHIFPEYSLSYGLGIAQLMLIGRVQCWEDVGIPISDGLGYITSEDFIRSNISVDSLRQSFVLHWSGTAKPFVVSPPQSFRHEWNDVLTQLGAPAVQDLKLPTVRRKALLVTDTPSGSEWFMDLLDQHPRVCAAKGGIDAFPRESLITGDFHNLNIDYCSRSVSCTWSFTSQWVPVFYRYSATYCGAGNQIQLFKSQFPNAEDVYLFNRVRMCSWVDAFHKQNLTMTPQSLFDMYVKVAFGDTSQSMLGCTCPPSKDVQLLKFVSDWWVGDRQKAEHFDHRIFGLSKSNFESQSGVHVRQDFRYKQGFLNRLNSAELSIDFKNFTVVSFSRQNVFEQYVMSQLADRESKFPDAANNLISINVDRMLHYIEEALMMRKAFFQTLEQQCPHVLYLTYEECVLDPSDCVRRAQLHMNLDEQAVDIDDSVSSMKNENVFGRIKNAEDVRRALRKYGFTKWIMDESGNFLQGGELQSAFLIPSISLTYKSIAEDTKPTYWWDGSSDRLIFLHIHRTGGSTLTEVLGGKQFPTVNVSGQLIPRHTLRNQFHCLPDATCKIQNFAADVLDGPAKDSCWQDWPGATAHYIRRLQELEATNCRLVELHHFDITAAMPFTRNGFKIITIVREPLSHLMSRFEYELLKEWTWTGELVDEPYNATFERFARWTEFQSSPQEALRYFTGCTNARISDPQFDFLEEKIEQASIGLCRYEYLNGRTKFPIAPNTAGLMVPLALQVVREKIATVLIFEAWTQSLALVSKKHAIPLTHQDMHLNAVADHKFSFSMLPEVRQRHLRSRLLPDTVLYDLLSKHFSDDADRHEVDLNSWYSECTCTQLRFGTTFDSVLCENKVSEDGDISKMCVPSRSDGTCELDQIRCFASRQSPPTQTLRQSAFERVADWEHAAWSRLTSVFKVFRAYISSGPSVQPAAVSLLSSSRQSQSYSYELRDDTYCGGSRTQTIAGPEGWELEDALDACDEINGCLCVSKYKANGAAESWELSVFDPPTERQLPEMNALVLNPTSLAFCGSAQQWVAGDSRCYLRENKMWISYKKNV